MTSGLAVFAVIQRDRAQRQTVRAEAEARTAQETTRFLVDLFKISDPSEARGNTVTAREMLDKGAARVQSELAKEPAIQARLMDTLGTVYMGLGLYPQARPLLDQAVATRRRLQDVDPLELSDSLSHQGTVMQLQAEYETGETLVGRSRVGRLSTNYESISRLSMRRVVPRVPAASTTRGAPAAGSSKRSCRRIDT